MKLWQKETSVSEAVEKFTVGKDRELDMQLAPFDVLGSLAHIQMLGSVGLLSAEELAKLQSELKNIYHEILDKRFTLDDGVEDIHSQVELVLTRRLGDTGKKIHSARSRNDQVLVDLRLFYRDKIEGLVAGVTELFKLLIRQSEKYKNDLLPGYTHLQLAMPSSFGLWFGAYAESLIDDMVTLEAAYRVVNKNPLGSAAGYGSSFPIDRQLTTELLGFAILNYNVVYAQMGRGKTERILASSMSNIGATLAKLSMDVCLYLNPDLAFISFPTELTTGSSIMPHKKNPDVFELIRAYSNRLQALPNEIMLMTANLTSGYHRDMQLLKEHMIPAFDELGSCLSMMCLMLENIQIRTDILKDDKYRYLFSVEEVNKLVEKGIPFRDAYMQISQSIERNEFSHSGEIVHSHLGSIGNLCNQEIGEQMDKVVSRFDFSRMKIALQQLLD